MSQTPTAVRGTNRQVLAVAGLFGVNGLGVGIFGGSLPGLRAQLSLDAANIVGVLVAAAVFAVASMNVSGPLSDRVGARVPSLLGGVGMAAGAAVMGAASDYVTLVVGAAILGLGNGAMDVAMNTLGVSLEQARGRPVMSRLHGCFSIGNLVGALVVVGFGALPALDASPRWPLWCGAVTVGVLLALLRGVIPQSPPRTVAEGRAPKGAVPVVAWLLAAMAVCFGLTEGTAIDWSSLHVTDVAQVSPSSGAWGLACVAGLMVVIRLLGDTVVELLGRASAVRAGSVCALFGYLVTAFASGLGPVLLGWCLVGLGVGLIAPQIYALAGHLGGGSGLAVVVSFGYSAFLVGPAVIGYAASQVGLQQAMLVPVVTAVGLIVMSLWLPADPVRSEH